MGYFINIFPVLWWSPLSFSLLMIHLAIWGRLTFDINVEHFVQPHQDLHNDDDDGFVDDHSGLD